MHVLIFGPGFTARTIADHARTVGAALTFIGRDDMANASLIADHVQKATHILSSVPPEGDHDPVLARYASLIADAAAGWIGYLSSTGVYGDTKGAWIDENGAILGRRAARNAADLAWGAINPHVRRFRLPGIYGPGRSALERVATDGAHRIAMPEQVFSRIHVDDIASAVIASFTQGPPGIYNLADDLPAPQNDVITYAARLLNRPVPPLLSLNDPALSAETRAFYGENRRVANIKAKRQLGWKPAYPDYRSGLAACLASIPAKASTSSAG